MSGPFYEELCWEDVIRDYVIKKDSEKVRKNSANDFGLPAGYYYCCGTRLTEWTTVWVSLKEEFDLQVRRMCCDGRIGSVQLLRNQNGSLSLVANDALMIASIILTHNVLDIPDDIKPFVPTS